MNSLLNRMGPLGVGAATAAIGWFVMPSLFDGRKAESAHAKAPPSPVEAPPQVGGDPVDAVRAEARGSSQFARIAEWRPPQSARALVAWFERLDELPTPEAEELAWKMLLSGDSTLSPKVIVRVAREMGRPLDELFERWAERDPEAAIAAALRGGHHSEIDAAISHAALDDPARSLAILEKLRTEFSSRWEPPYWALFRRWAEKDLDAARTNALDLPKQWRHLALGGIAATWAKYDPRAAAAWAREFPPSEARSLISTIAQEWVQADRVAAIDFLMKEGRAALGDPRIRGVFGRWAETDVYGLRDWVLRQAENLPMEAYRASAEAAVGALAKNDPGAAWELTATLPQERRDSFMYRIAGDWLQRDPAAAVDWVRSLPGEEDRRALFNIVGTYARSLSPDQQRQLGQTLSATSPEEAGVRVTTLATFDPASCRDAWNALPTPQRGDILESVIDALERESPLVAADILAGEAQNQVAGETPTPEWSRTGMKASKFAVTWGMRDANAVRQWLGSLPETSLTEVIAYNYTRNCGVMDSSSAEAWIDSLPAGSQVRIGAERGLKEIRSGGKENR